MADATTEAGGAPSGPPGALPLPPGFPPGVDPETFRLADVTALLRAAAYFPLRTRTAAPGLDGLGGPAGGAASFRLDARLHRFELGGEGGREPAACNRLDGSAGRLVATVRPLPTPFFASPDIRPPPTPFDPGAGQRLGLYDVELPLEGNEHGISGFGAGRTFPVPGRREVPFAAVVEVTGGWGRFAGLAGAVVLDGSLHPPDRVTVQAVVRLMDPDGRVTTGHRVPPGRTRGDARGSTTFALLGEVDPERPVRLIVGPGGLPVGSRVYERLRLVGLDFSLGEVRPRARLVEGPLVGEVEAILIFDPLSPAPVRPIQTRRGVFRLFAGDGRGGDPVATIAADMIEGRAFATRLPGAPAPVFRFAGFGPLLSGTGRFAGASGMLTMNSAISVFPRTLSNLYLLRFADPDGRLRGRCGLFGSSLG